MKKSIDKRLKKRLEKAWRIMYRKKNGGSGSSLLRGTRKEARKQFRAMPWMEAENCEITDMRKVWVARSKRRHPSTLVLAELENSAESLAERMAEVESECRALRARVSELERPPWEDNEQEQGRPGRRKSSRGV